MRAEERESEVTLRQSRGESRPLQNRRPFARFWNKSGRGEDPEALGDQLKGNYWTFKSTRFVCTLRMNGQGTDPKTMEVGERDCVSFVKGFQPSNDLAT